MQRYHRQSLLPQIGSEGQKRLLDSKVLIVGAGGLGHPVAQYLAAMGVGQIKIVDGDGVQVTNLHRQVLFTDQDIGKNKAEVLSRKIATMSPDLHSSYEPYFLTKTTALKLFSDCNLVVDCTDNFESKFLINDVCALYDKPMVYGAISQFEGQIGIFWKSKGACYRCLYPQRPESKIQSCAEAGVVGPVVGVVGSLQAMEAMKILIGNDEDLKPLFGRVNFYNFCDHSLRSLQISVRATCPCHSFGYSPDEILEIRTTVCDSSSATALVDVREHEEWNEYHIEGSLNVPLSRLERGDIPAFASDREIVLICKAGARAQRALEIFVSMKFSRVRCADKGVYEYQAK